MRTIIARFDGHCGECRATIIRGSRIQYDETSKSAYCAKCKPVEPYQDDANALADRLKFERKGLSE